MLTRTSSSSARTRRWLPTDSAGTSPRGAGPAAPSGSEASARTSSTRASTPASTEWASSRSAPAVRRDSASHASTSVNAEMSKSRSSTSRRSSGVARRKAANSPWGRSTTLANWAMPMPRASRTTSATSSCRVLRPTHRESRRSSSVTIACTFDHPVPRRLGRWNSGERRIRNLRPPVVSSSVTRGTASGAAWSLRRPRLEREPGTSAYSAKQMASSRLVLPDPVGPWMRNSPSADRASTSTTTRSANGPNASISSRWTLTRHPPTRR